MHINGYHIKTDDSEIFNPIRINWPYANTKGTVLVTPHIVLQQKRKSSRHWNIFNKHLK